jgi:hypothetical protein
MLNQSQVRDAIGDGAGILRLEPNWVPRSFMIPGRRLRLHPDDLYAYGVHRGGINERWLASTTQASNGPETGEFEGLSFIRHANGSRSLLKEAIEVAGDDLLGSAMAREGGWNLLCKFFDNMGPMPHHMHQSPEAFYFPPQYNQVENHFPCTFMGLEPGTTKDDIRHCLENWNRGDNGILHHSRAYRLIPGEGWQIDPGILHAPGSLVTYAPQAANDVSAMFQSLVEGRIVDWSLMTKDVPPRYHHDPDYLISMLDWDANVNERFAESNKRKPQPVYPLKEMENGGYREMWIAYCSGHYSAKELTVFPGRAVTIRDAEAYGIIVVQGWGKFGAHEVTTPSMIRFGDMTQDEFFVTASAAQAGVRIVNTSDSEPLVVLKHFGPDNPDAEPLRRKRAKDNTP